MTFNDKYRIFYPLIILSVPISFIVAYNTSWWWLIFGFIWFRIVGILFVSIGLHRYFAHRSFKTGPKRHIMLVLGSVLTGNGSPITFTTKHLHHHKHSDKELDIHSPKDGILHSAFLWPMGTHKWFFEIKQAKIPMFILKDRLINKVHNNYFLIWCSLALILFLIDWKLPLFFLAFPAGMSVLVGNTLINCLNHLKIPGSYRNYDTNDTSYNNKWIQWIETGEGYHNNHHQNMIDYNFARMPGEVDPCAWIIDKFLKVNVNE
jgi:stearoyl-CoA desaturase (delta-9 desaturase)